MVTSPLSQMELSGDLAQVALSELRETPALRSHGVATLRAWLASHPRIRGCRTDAPFLLRFLRTTKFSVPLAQDMLERYLSARQLFPHWFRGLDVDDPQLAEILDAG